MVLVSRRNSIFFMSLGFGYISKVN
jgi:hypothetical protein